MENQLLKELSNAKIPEKLPNKINAVLGEVDEYAADELVELGEEILSQLAAIGIACYLQQENQKEVFNDFLVNLFLGTSDINAGPIYRWTANMLTDVKGGQADKLKSFFWQEIEGKQVLNEQIHHLSSLRNDVMHGFFVLPPERNREEAQKMAVIITQLIDAKFFDIEWGQFHFIEKSGFNGNWKITDENSWEQFQTCFTFGELASRIRKEYSLEFRKHEDEFINSKTNTDKTAVDAAGTFLANNKKGGLALWHRPDNGNGAIAYASIVNSLDRSIYLPIYYSLHNKGVTFSSTFLLKEVGQALAETTGVNVFLKDPLKAVQNKENIKKRKRRPVVILNNIHIALFNQKLF